MTEPASHAAAGSLSEEVSKKRKADEMNSNDEKERQPKKLQRESTTGGECDTEHPEQKDDNLEEESQQSMEIEPEAASDSKMTGGQKQPVKEHVDALGESETATNSTREMLSETRAAFSDAPGGTSTPPTLEESSMEVTVSPEKAIPLTAVAVNDKNDYSKLRWIVVRNDGKPESMIKLIGLKSLFAKQLPKMPRAYIARLVLDRRHTSLAILSDKPEVKDSDEEIIGGICYRAFDDMRFAEIAFCAVNANHQVKGYGTKLMNLLKQLGAETGIEQLITYADNYAIGYFKKQGFSKSISMSKGRYFGLIKEYDGGTPMECYIHPSIDYTRIPEMLQAQREFILKRVRLTSNSHQIYEPLPKGFSAAAASAMEGGTSSLSLSRANPTATLAMAIPGMAEAGWTLADLRNATGQGKEVDRQKTALKTELLALLRKVEEQQFAWPFREPVNTEEVPDYLDVIKDPIDLSLIEKRIRVDNFYRSKDMFFADILLMTNNCKTYNDETSTYTDCAVKLEKFISQLRL